MANLLIPFGGDATQRFWEALEESDNVFLVAQLAKGWDGTVSRAIKTDTDGNLQVDVLSGGGGTQYTEGDIDASITGMAALAEGAGDALRPLLVDASQHLQVDLAAASVTVTVDGSAFTQPVSGTFWQATQPVSAASLPLPSGAATDAKLDTMITSLAIIDNVLFGAGLEATALRVTLPTDGTGKVSLAASSGTDIGNVGVPGGVATTNAGTFVVQENGAALTALQLIDNAVSGAGFNITQLGGAAVPIGAGLEATAVRVTLPTDGTGVVKLGSSTAGIGKLTANSGVDIGDVDVTSLTGITVPNGEYETVAASQTAQVLGGTGATGDYLKQLLVIPATTSPGNVIILDNAISITVFTGGASSVSNLVPFVIPVEAYSVSGAWKVTTGANVSVLAVGNFAA